MVRHIFEFAECIICLDSFEAGNRAQLKCAHNICNGCFSKHLDVTINENCFGFPTCPHPDCYTAASDKLISEHVDEQTAARMRYLRALHPTRRHDGKRMWCTAPNCYEPLPPPTPIDPNSSECPRCSTRSSLLSIPEDNVANEQFKKYAVGRTAECPRCGIHVELAGGCQRVTCAKCNHTFQFRPMKSSKRTSTITSSRIDRTTQPLTANYSPLSGITRSSSVRSNDSIDSIDTKEQTAQILARVRSARLERNRAHNVPITSSREALEKPPVRLLSPPTSEATDDEFGIMARIDNLRGKSRVQPPTQAGQTLDTSKLRRMKSVPSINDRVPKRKSIFDEEFGTSSPMHSPARTQGILRRFVGRVVDRDYTRSSNRNIDSLRSGRSVQFEASQVSPLARSSTISRRQSANPRRFQTNYISASRLNNDRFDILSDRVSIVQG